MPRSESIVTPKTVTREYALVCNGRYVFSSSVSVSVSFLFVGDRFWVWALVTGLGWFG